MPRIIFLCLMPLLGVACAQQNIITHVNQLPFFAPSHLRYATRDGTLPLEIYGALPAGITPDYLAQAVHLPANYAVTRLVPSPPGAAADKGRLVLVFQPHFQMHPERVCEGEKNIVTGSDQNVRALVAFCIGERLATSGQLRIPANKASPVSIARSINVVLSVMIERPPNEGGLISRW